MSKQARGQATTDRVLDAALACFVRDGVQGATIQDIAARSGVSIGSIYHHLGSRERILLELYRRCLERMLAHVTRAVLRRRDARDGVRALVTSYLRFVEKHRAEALLIFAAAHTELTRDFRPELAELAARVTAPIAQWLAPHVAAGTVIALPRPLYEVVLIGPAAEAARRILSGAPGLSFTSARRVLPELVWSAVEVKRPGRRVRPRPEQRPSRPTARRASARPPR
ncbi:MAG: TetR/AcrR family transcriptional regulator [Polyangia bacterium]